MAPPLGHRLRRAWRELLGRSFDAAGTSGRWPAPAAMPAPVSSALAARAPVARRAAYLATNAPYAAAYVSAWTTNLVGDGASFRSGHPDQATAKALERAWLARYGSIDAEGISDLTGFLWRAVRSLVVAGEAFVHLGPT